MNHSFFRNLSIGLLILALVISVLFPQVSTFLALAFLTGFYLAVILCSKTSPLQTSTTIPNETKDSRSPQVSEERYEELLGKYELLINNIAAAILVRDETHKIIFCSPYAESLFGYMPAEVLELAYEHDIVEHITPEEGREVHRKALQFVELGEPYQYRFCYTHRSGMTMWAETRIVPIFELDNQRVGSLSITIDVTANVRYEQQIEEKNRDLNDFAYMVSHDLKAPIYTVKGMANVLQEELTPEENSGDVQSALVHIGGAVKSLESLVSGILEYSRVSQNHMNVEEVHIKTVLTEVVRDHRQLVNELNGTIDIASDLPVVLADHRALYQIFSNLIGNALKYTKRGVNPHIQIFAEPGSSSDNCIVHIKDNGVGIAENEMASVFRPFNRGSLSGYQSNFEEQPEGLGIGLACVHKLVERLGGRISVSSVVNQGSTFSLILRKIS